MNCDNFKNMILLADSEELLSSDLQILTKHLSECESCSEYRNDICKIITIADKSLATGVPGNNAIINIQEAVKKQQGRKIVIFPNPTLQIFAYAATLILCVGGWFMFSQDNQIKQSSDINTILAMVSEEDVVDKESPNHIADEQKELRILARQLLLIEGLAADDFNFEENHEFDLDDSQPTALQLRNIAWLLQKIYV